jgi:divalent metal cation (Fe/Co/Zn/Cd) transporter
MTSVVWSGIVGMAAVTAALQTGSLSLFGFGADAVVDAVASVALVWRFLVEAREPERAARVEQIAERVLGGVLISLAVYLAVASIRSLAIGSHPEAAFANIVLLVASVVVLPPLALAKNRLALRMGSGALRADSILTGFAALLAMISLLSLAASESLGIWWADAVAAMVVAVLVFREGWGTVRMRAT